MMLVYHKYRWKCMEKDWERFSSSEGATKKELRQPLWVAEFFVQKVCTEFCSLLITYQPERWFLNDLNDLKSPKDMWNIAGGNRTPITRTGILCDILYTTATVLDYLTIEGGFWQGLSLEFWHKKSPDEAWPHPDWIILFLSCAEENRVVKIEGDPIITVFGNHNRDIAFMFSTREETII